MIHIITPKNKQKNRGTNEEQQLAAQRSRPKREPTTSKRYQPIIRCKHGRNNPDSGRRCRQSRLGLERCAEIAMPDAAANRLLPLCSYRRKTSKE